MEHDFWHARWQREQIGFHEAQVNEVLVRHWPAVAGADPGPVLVPLCGKSLDMVWLAERGHTVVGAELSEIAVRDFFAAQDLDPAVRESGRMKVFEAADYQLWCGDFMALTATDFGGLTLAYDRAALIALPPAMRPAYARALMARLVPGARLLLVTLQYADAELNGPPFNVPLTEVETLFGDQCAIEHLAHAPSKVKGRFEVQQTATRLILER